MFASDALIESSCILAASGLLPTHLSLTILQALTDSSNIPIHTFSPSIPWIFGTLLVIITGFFRLRSYRALGRHFTYELSVLKRSQAHHHRSIRMGATSELYSVHRVVGRQCDRHQRSRLVDARNLLPRSLHWALESQSEPDGERGTRDAEEDPRARECVRTSRPRRCAGVTDQDRG
jgi:hypothetical protein